MINDKCCVNMRIISSLLQRCWNILYGFRHWFNIIGIYFIFAILFFPLYECVFSRNFLYELLILHYCTRRSRPLSDAPSIETTQHGNCQESHRYLTEGIAGELSNHFSSSAFRFISTPILPEIASRGRILLRRFYCCQDKRLMHARLRCEWLNCRECFVFTTRMVYLGQSAWLRFFDFQHKICSYYKITDLKRNLRNF